MKILYILIFLLFYSVTSSQTDNNQIFKIRKTVEQINKDSGYITKTLDVEQFLGHSTDNGGELTGYFKNGQLVKIIEWVGLSTCINITEYYLLNDKLIFAYSQVKEYQYVDSIGSFNYSNQTVAMECRFYYENGKYLKSILKGSTRFGEVPDKSWSKKYQNECKQYIKLLKPK